MRNFLHLSLLCLSLTLTGCGTELNGGSEAGNPSGMRLVSGSVESESVEVLSLLTLEVCLADTVLATDSQGNETKATIESDCTFELELDTGKMYSLSLWLDKMLIALFEFDNDIDQFPSSFLTLGAYGDGMNLGQVQIVNGSAVPEFEPTTQNDLDGDGVPDSVDIDDDGDGISDDQELDCDLDGVIDDFDNDSEDCVFPEPEEGEKFAIVMEVLPRNGAGIEAVLPTVAVNSAILVRINCHITEGSVTNETVHIEAEEDEVNCSFAFGSASNRFTCNPTEDLLPNTVYTGTVDGVTCNDGRVVPETSWEFKTAME